MLIEDDVHPEMLMTGISDTSVFGKILLSLGIHILLVLLTSIGFIKLCVVHKSLDPRAVIAQQKEEADQQEKEAKKAKLQEEAIKKQKKQKDGKTAPVQNNKPTAGEKPAGEKIAPVEKRLQETSKERPKGSGMDLDLDLDNM